MGCEEAEGALATWITCLDEVALYSADDPVFPGAALRTHANSGFAANGFTRAH